MKKKNKVYVVMVFAMVLVCVYAALAMAGYDVMEARAEEVPEGAAVEMQMLYVNTDTKVYESDNEQSEVLLELSASSMAVLLEDDGEWMKVMYQGVTGYVKASALQIENPNPEAAEEYMELAEYDAAFIDELERLTAEKRRSRIYGVMIVVLIAAIFGVGIFTTLKKRKGQDGVGTADAQDPEQESIKASEQSLENSDV